MRILDRRLLRTIGMTFGAVAAALLLHAADTTGTERASAQPAAQPGTTVLGSWKLACECNAGMVVELVSTGRSTAVGRVKVLGRGRTFRYKVGDEILRLTASSSSAWSGQLLWRNAAGVSRWQPITMRLVNQRLHGVTANEHCYEHMERTR